MPDVPDGEGLESGIWYAVPLLLPLSLARLLPAPPAEPGFPLPVPLVLPPPDAPLPDEPLDLRRAGE